MKSWNDFANEEPELAKTGGCAEIIRDPATRQALITDTKILVGENEMLFELKLDRVMHTRLEDPGTPNERPVHRKWRASKQM